ncbi:helix-turn-helix domain-containing protein [Arhodomonas sp. AD133]|uniref:helix-turn-helix domain-containing protein n=1 Tax=Arhodomonas sp. AD133 TaxID=3415009 RepID=UPI003EBCF770
MSDYLSMGLGEKIRQIREAEGLTRKAFAERTGIPKDTIMRIEQGRNEPKGPMLQTIGRMWPQYAYWLLTDQTDAANGHISPELAVTPKNLPEA